MKIRVELTPESSFQVSEMVLVVTEEDRSYYRPVDNVDLFDEWLREPVKKMLALTGIDLQDSLMSAQIDSDINIIEFSPTVICVGDSPEDCKSIEIPLERFVEIKNSALGQLRTIEDVKSLKEKMNIK